MSERYGKRFALGLLVLLAVAARPAKTMGESAGKINVSRHLGVVGRVNLGSYYTPARYVRLVGGWLIRQGVGPGWTIADLSCGYGAFFELSDVAGLSCCRYVGNDIDSVAIKKAQTYFPQVEFSGHNALVGVSREKFGFGAEERIVIVGNPPYNDVTSQINQGIKSFVLPVDPDLRTRDLGISSLLAYDKIRADLVAVLHPLSYLIKRQNFSAARAFFLNYRMLDHAVVSSQEFEGTSKTAAFPVIVALYGRAEGMGISYEDVRETWFRTVEGNRFSLSGFDYVTDEIEKYPSRRRYRPEILFYTLRDINALRRSRTFLIGRISNAVDVDPEKLSHYCYIDCFKRFAKVPYYLGNFNIPFVRDEFRDVEFDMVRVSKHAHPEVFGVSEKPSQKTYARVRAYIEKSLNGKECPYAD